MDRTNIPDFSGPELCTLQAHEVVDLLAKRDVSPTELLDAAFARIEAVEPAVNAMPILCPDRAYADARRIENASSKGALMLGGLPVGIKDLNAVKGVRCTLGTKGYEHHVSEHSDHFVDRLEANGAIVVGKTNTPELGAGANTFNEVFGRTRNPWNTALNPAGSSGGAAVSLAVGETWFSQGSDHGGSLRTPAAYCGIVGFRPSPGRVTSRLSAGQSSGWVTEGVNGPMARSVRDCALFLDAMSGFERAVPASFPSEGGFEDAVLRADPKVRIAFSADLNGLCPVESVIAEALEAAVAMVEREGGVVDRIEPDLPGLEKTYTTIRAMDFATGAARFPEEIRKHFKPDIQDNIKRGAALTIDEIVDANINRTTLFLAMERILQDFDVLACPVVGCMPRKAEITWIEEINGLKFDTYIGWLRFTYLATTCGLPAISVPVAISPDGLPIGIQLIGPPRGEAKVLATARAVELAVGGPLGPIDPVIRHQP